MNNLIQLEMEGEHRLMEKEWIINELPAKTWNWLKMNESQVTAVTDAIPCIPQVGVETSDNSNGSCRRV